MKLNIILLILAFIVLMRCAFSRENSSFLEYTETEYGGDLEAMDRAVIDSKIEGTFQQIGRTLAEGTEQNVSGVAYQPFGCGDGDQNRLGNGRCNKFQGSCVPRDRGQQINCNAGMVLEYGGNCACLMLTTDHSIGSQTKRGVGLRLTTPSAAKQNAVLAYD
jgi:hypothetical protein